MCENRSKELKEYTYRRKIARKSASSFQEIKQAGRDRKSASMFSLHTAESLLVLYTGLTRFAKLQVATSIASVIKRTVLAA
jgi:hypothetical protein